MDLYAWLSYRTPQVPRGKSVSIKLSDLKQIFGQDIKEVRKFKQNLRRDLLAIAKIYSDFKIEIRGDMLILRHSPPPVPSKQTALLLD